MQFPWRSLRRTTRHHGGSWPPTATQWLLGVTALCLLTQWFFSADAGAIRSIAALSMPGLAVWHWWQPLTYLFLGRGSWLEFAALLAFYLAGSNLEFIIGRRHLLTLYFLAGMLGGLGQLAYDAAAATSPIELAGPTAAVMGVILGLTSVMPNLELAPLLGFPLPFWLKIKHCALVVVVICAGLAVGYPHGAFAQKQAARCLVGCLTGCVYLRQLGFGRRMKARSDPSDHEPMLEIPVFSQAAEPQTILEAEAAHQRFTERERRMTPRQYISEQIDPILDKISLHGIGCLTASERRLLEKGRDKISQSDV